MKNILASTDNSDQIIGRWRLEVSYGTPISGQPSRLGESFGERCFGHVDDIITFAVEEKRSSQRSSAAVAGIDKQSFPTIK
jgi:hypothetical protein